MRERSVEIGKTLNPWQLRICEGGMVVHCLHSGLKGSNMRLKNADEIQRAVQRDRVVRNDAIQVRHNKIFTVRDESQLPEETAVRSPLSRKVDANDWSNLGRVNKLDVLRGTGRLFLTEYRPNCRWNQDSSGLSYDGHVPESASGPPRRTHHALCLLAVRRVGSNFHFLRISAVPSLHLFPI